MRLRGSAEFLFGPTYGKRIDMHLKRSADASRHQAMCSDLLWMGCRYNKFPPLRTWQE